MFQKLLAYLLIGGVAHDVWGSSEGTNAIPLRQAVAIVSTLRLSADSLPSAWEAVLGGGLASEFGAVKSIHVLPESSSQFAFSELHFAFGQQLDSEQARRLGQVLEAQWVACQSYGRRDGKWSFSVRVIKVATGQAFEPIEVTSTNWFHCVMDCALGALRQMEIVPKQGELEEMRRQPFNSDAAFDLVAASVVGKGPLTNTEATLRQALSIDPECGPALAALSEVLIAEQNPDDAAQVAKQLLSMFPHSGLAHDLLGTSYAAGGLRHRAREEFLKAAQTAPDDPDSYMLLAALEVEQSNWEDAAANLQKAAAVSPYLPKVHAELGRAYARLGKRGMAIEELNRAERCQIEPTRSPEMDQLLTEGYALLGDIAQAIKFYEEFLASVHRTRPGSTIEQEGNRYLAGLKARLEPHFINAAMPHAFTPVELQSALSARLTPEEMQVVVNPLATSEPMKKFAHDLVGSTDTDMEKARRLFDGLQHYSINDPLGSFRTAAEVFRDWTNPEATFTCQEYALLYIALAREVGLKAFYVWVTKDYTGEQITHVCAGIFANGKALLIDRGDQWFGAEHKEFKFHDDLEMIGIYLAQWSDVNKVRVATKLMPDSAIPYFNLAHALIVTNRVPEARQALDAGLRLDSNSWLALCSRGELALREGKWDDAATFSRASLEISPNYGPSRFILAEALYYAKKLPEARAEFRKYLQGATATDMAVAAYDAITYIDSQIPEIHAGN